MLLLFYFQLHGSQPEILSKKDFYPTIAMIRHLTDIYNLI